MEPFFWHWTDDAPPGYPWHDIAVPVYQFRSLEVSHTPDLKCFLTYRSSYMAELLICREV